MFDSSNTWLVCCGGTSTPFLCSGLLQECAWCWAAWSFPTGGTPRWSGTCAASRRGNTHWATARYAGPICWPSWASWTPSFCLSWPSSWATGRRTSIWMICRQTTKVSKRNNNLTFARKKAGSKCLIDLAFLKKPLCKGSKLFDRKTFKKKVKSLSQFQSTIIYWAETGVVSVNIHKVAS